MNGKLPIVGSLLCALLLLAGICGCTTVDQTVSLNYAPLERAFGQQSGEFIVSRVDSRPFARNARGEWIIGSLNNVHGVHQADLLADRNQGEWISEALLLELKHSGYTVTRKSPLPPDTARGIEIRDLNASLNVNQDLFTSSAKQELKFNVDLYLNGTKIKTFAVVSRASHTLPLKASAEENARIMLQSMQDAMQQVMAEVSALFDRK
ncbi:YajG family lipoprotein [Pelobacter propionicus]|uniref:ABC-type transport auxiliary lipoprotein component domain-containing protein n=1 Tax=Pelobacter propionicus (strain DSM 2379 / NBRC 103807 / OttBd1) TaxID=338966 RepID=A1AR84_PELPD|nr:hypothetical protein [Pelobacter propionicus]ABK99854.1 hypothetical protein Ppro_2247 [Pelobacter propionicus DSM 2379]